MTREYKVEYDLKKEQEEVLYHNDGNILVSASAGSGKTFVMIERAIRLIVEKKANVGQILAVTFTDASAQEMKDRLKQALTKKISQTGDMELMGELSDIATADISTLHSFCGRLVRTYFYKLGLSPDFSISDEANATVLRKHSVDQTFREFYDKKEGWFLELVDKYQSGRRDEELKKHILELYLFANEEANPIEFLSQSISHYTNENFDRMLGEYLNAFLERINQLSENLNEILDKFIKLDNKKAVKFCTDLCCELEKAKYLKDVYQVKKFIGFKLTKSLGTKLDEEQSLLKIQATECYDEFIKMVIDFSSHITDRETDRAILTQLSDHTKNIITIIERFSEIYSSVKREENLLDFGDLGHFALELLQDEQIRQEVSQKYKYIFVDEYQDVNSVQEEIISRIANDNLFMVGDEKQSIYGFRGCRPEIFQEKFNLMQKKGQKAVLLNYNFRSASAVLDMANEIFSFAMTKRNFAKNYKDDSMLISGGKYEKDAVGRAKIHLLKNSPKQEKEKKENNRIYNILDEIKKQREEEHDYTATLLRRLIDQELGKTYYNPKQKKYLPITYKDIVILTRNKAGKYLSSIVHGLTRHGIPVSSEVATNVCDYPEIECLVALLQLVDCFYQDLPLAITLKSNVGEFSDEDLYEIANYYLDEVKVKKGFSFAYDYYLKNAKTSLCERLKEFDRYVKDLRTLSDFIGAYGILEKVINDKHLRAKLYASVDGDSKVLRLNRFLDACKSATGSSYTVKEFLEIIKNSPESFKCSQIAQENTVRIMTIHASKGLEFPVVFVIGLENAMSRKDETTNIFSDRQYGIAVKHFDSDSRRKRETLLRGIIKEKKHKDRVREELRLFYVATTRATYSMHLVIKADEDLRKDEFYSANKFFDYIPKKLEVETYTYDQLNFENLTKPIRKVLIGKEDADITLKMQRKFSYVYDDMDSTTLALKSTVTALNKREDDEIKVLTLFDESDNGDQADAYRGTIAHRVLELFDFNSQDDIFIQTEKMVKDGFIKKSDLQQINLERLQKAILSECLSSVKNMDLYREKNFLALFKAKDLFDVKTDEKVLVQGVIDLLATDGKKAIIIDYKYSKLSKDSLVNKYKKQLDLYAKAVENVCGIKVEKKVLLNIFTGESVEIL